jgi:hypothetical protein
MNRNQYLSLFALSSLLALVACGAAPTAVPPSAAASALPPTETPSAVPSSTATSALPPTETPSAVAPSETPSPLPPSEGEGNADVLHVRAVQAQDGTWTFHVTVQHPDTGWEDYADGWDVLTPDGTVLKPDPESPFTRLLLHPHENEQPFTRSQNGIVIPTGATRVRVRAHDLVDGYGGREVLVDLTVRSGEGFEVQPRP